jgi:hypothetical protein
LILSVRKAALLLLLLALAGCGRRGPPVRAVRGPEPAAAGEEVPAGAPAPAAEAAGQGAGEEEEEEERKR